MKILTLTLTVDTPFYNFFDDIKRQYLRKNNEDFLFVYNGKQRIEDDPTVINYSTDSDSNGTGIPVMFDKFINALERENNLEKYDFVIRCNSSTFVNVDVIRSVLKDYSSKEHLYLGNFNNSWNFCSGACCIFSRKTLKALVDNKNKVNVKSVPDDVAIGEILSVSGVSKTFIHNTPNYINLVDVPPYENIFEALKSPWIRVRNDHNREVIDKAVWRQISTALKLKM